MIEEAQFLLDRLAEYNPEDQDHVRDFHGHIIPAMARLRAAIPITRSASSKQNISVVPGAVVSSDWRPSPNPAKE